MKPNRLSLLYSLFSILNENNVEDSNYILAKYFLEHYRSLPQLNIYDVAEDCYVSRASVRRFCMSIGFENFLDLKSEFAKYDDEREYYQKHALQDNYREQLTQEINEMIQELDQRMNTDEVSRIAERIYNSRYTVILTADSSVGSIRDFQQSMIFNDKILYSVSELFSENELLEQLDEQDYLITLSNTGQFALAVQDIVQNVKAFKALITVNRNPVFLEWYDKVYHLSAEDRSKEGGNVYGKYGMSYMLDIIYSEYTRKYKPSRK